MTVKELFKNVSFEELWKEYVKIENLDEEKYPYDRYGRKYVFNFIREYDGKKSEDNIIVCIKDCGEFLAVSGFYSDEILPFKISEMTNDDLQKIELYGLEYYEIYEWANWEVFQKSIETYGEIVCAAHILYEITFFGTNINESRESLLYDIYEEIQEWEDKNGKEM